MLSIEFEPETQKMALLELDALVTIFERLDQDSSKQSLLYFK
jgi:hypothetical protein